MGKKLILRIAVLALAQLSLSQVAWAETEFTCFNVPMNGTGYVYEIQRLDKEAKLKISSAMVWHGMVTNGRTQMYDGQVSVSEALTGKLILKNFSVALVLDQVNPASVDATTGVVVTSPTPVVKAGELKCQPGLDQP